VCDTLTGQKTRLICAVGPAPCVIGGTLMRDEPCVRARKHACTAACVHASDGACACATKYGRADRMTDGGTPRATESGDSRDTSSHSPTHFRLELSTFSLSLSLFSSSHIDWIPPCLPFYPPPPVLRPHARWTASIDTFFPTIDLRRI